MAVFAVLGIAILAVWGWQTLKTQAPESKETALNTPEVKEVKLEENTPQYRIKASYPEFHNLGDASREAAANAAIKTEIEKEIKDFKGYAEEAMDIVPEAKSELQIGYEAVHVNPSIASIKLSNSTYIEGAAHPFNVYISFNYSFRDLSRITLAELFNPSSNYLSLLADYSRQDLKNQLKDYYTEETVAGGTDPKPENYEVFLLSEDKLILIFNVYSVASYAAGPQKVEISYDELSSIINLEGVIPLARQ